jgi:uncharacterized protein YdhG (YjbR/CyaY superfamily)
LGFIGFGLRCQSWTEHKAITLKDVMNFQTIDEYIENAAPEARSILREIRAVIAKAVPTAEETISYKMPAFKAKRTFVYFAAFKKHIGLYPPVRDPNLRKRVIRFANEKGNLSFPISEPFPYDLVAEVAQALAKQYQSEDSKS